MVAGGGSDGVLLRILFPGSLRADAQFLLLVAVRLLR